MSKGSVTTLFGQHRGDGSLYNRLVQKNLDKSQPLSIRVHTGFPGDSDEQEESLYRHLEYLITDIRVHSRLYEKSRPVNQLYLRTGYRSDSGDPKITELMYALSKNLNLIDSPLREYCYEAREDTDEDTLALLTGLGINKVVIRIAQKTDGLGGLARSIARICSVSSGYGIKSIAVRVTPQAYNGDKNTLISLLKTLVELPVDQLLLPEKLGCPCRKELGAITRLNFVHLGNNAFVRPHSSLAEAYRENRLQYNFYGYSSCYASDTLGIGIGSRTISREHWFAKPEDRGQYYDSLKEDSIPVVRGQCFQRDEQLRRSMVEMLGARHSVYIPEVENEWNIDFNSYFREELQAMVPYEEKGCVDMDAATISLSERGLYYLDEIFEVFGNPLSHGLNYGIGTLHQFPGKHAHQPKNGNPSP